MYMRHSTPFIQSVFFYGVVSALVFSGIIAFVTYSLPSQVASVRRALPPPNTLTTDVWGIFNPATGEIVAGSNVHAVRPIASVTKLFTAEAVLMSPEKNTRFTITESDVQTEGRAGKLVRGDAVTSYELLYPLLIESSNDAAHAITRHLGETYATTVYSLIESLALRDTVISEGSGLSPENVSTIYDLVHFYSHIKKTSPHILDISQLRLFINGTEDGYVNNNPAREFSSFAGGKHGFTDEAGKTFIGSFNSADGTKDIGVVFLGSSDIKADITALLAYGESVMGDSDIIAP